MTPRVRRSVATTLRHVGGLAELAGHLGSEITTLVQEVHAASSPVARLSARAPAAGIYAGIRVGFGGARRLAALGGRLAPRDPAPDAWLDVQSALNGAFGHLFDPNGGFALPISLQRGADPRGGERLVVFLHGLCLNERCWDGPAHARFVAWLHDRLGSQVAYLRYNTGLRISRNGALLADLLEREVPGGELILVGHSMGGLVALSALHQAQELELEWPRRVSRLACLGSPHEGTSLERIANHANRLLAASHWSQPMMRLANLRSDGIRDLRFGHVLERDWRGRPPDDPRPAPSAVTLAAGVDHLLVAGARSARGEADPLGDWLVPVRSALARRLHPEHAARRELIPELDHLGMLGDERVYRLLRAWLGRRA
jgi:pimeloyl-ACP methyl ester carboxylesterase